jgi:hypothetical protein
MLFRIFLRIRRFGKDSYMFINFQNGKAGKALKQANFEAIGAVKAS